MNASFYRRAARRLAKTNADEHVAIAVALGFVALIAMHLAGWVQ